MISKCLGWFSKNVCKITPRGVGKELVRWKCQLKVWILNTVCLILMLRLLRSSNFGVLYTKNEKSDGPSLNVRNVEWFFLYKMSVQWNPYIMAAQNTITPKMWESGTIHWLHGVGWHRIPVICYVEAVIIMPGEYFFCIQLKMFF